MEFRVLGNARPPLCSTEWFHLHVKIACFHVGVWLIGQGGWKLLSRPGYNSWQFTAQALAEKWRWAGNGNFSFFKTGLLNPILKRSDKTAC